MPFYVNYDAVMSGSMDFSYETASIGLSGFFQNNLSTFSGMIGYGLHPDPDVEGAWRNSLHLKATYSGLYPIFEASLDLGDQAAYQYTVSNIIQHYSNAKVQWSQLGAQLRKEPYLQASVRTYIPFSYNKGGILYGFTPQIRYTFTNNRYNIHPAVFEQGLRFDDIPGITSLSQPTDAKGVFMQRLSASLRGYCMRPRAQSQIYPRLGIGAEVGFSLRQGLREYFAPNVYAYVYGYLPGLWRTQGLRLSSTLQHRVGSDIFGEIVANTLPRGFKSAAMRAVGQGFDTQWKFTADYAIPLYFGDISIPYVAYIRNFLITPHFDITALLGQNEYQTIISHSGSIAGRTSSKTIPNLWSVGADISASLGRILFIPFDASIGVGTSYLGGNWFASSNNESRWAVELIFGIDF